MATRSLRPDAVTPPKPRRRDLGRWLYWTLRLAGFAATTLLVTWGLFVVFFVAIGSFSLDGTMRQLANFTTRYAAADAARVAQFQHLLLVAHLLLFAAVGLFRRRSLLPASDPQRSRPHV